MDKQVFTVAEVSERMGFSRQTITRLFESEPGVIVRKPGTKSKRRYRSLRIPGFVLDRVVRRLSV